VVIPIVLIVRRDMEKIVPHVAQKYFGNILNIILGENRGCV
jgi:hypothetical protein